MNCALLLAEEVGLASRLPLRSAIHIYILSTMYMCRLVPSVEAPQFEVQLGIVK